MKLRTSPLPLVLRHAFRIAHGSSTKRVNALVQLEKVNSGGIEGLGEAALPPYYPWAVADVEEYVASLSLDNLDTSNREYESIRSWLSKLPDGPAPARAAVDMAVHDAWSRQRGVPLHEALQLSDRKMPVSTYALPIPESLSALSAMLEEVKDFPFLKLKLGCGDPSLDVAIVQHTRKVYSGQLCVDVNSGWSVEEALRCIPKLCAFKLAFVEQPISHDWEALRSGSRADKSTGNWPPLVADESVQGLGSIRALAPHVDGINVKLAKCGGLAGALEQVQEARQLGLKCMLGCMIESSIALTAAAQIASLFDWLDLDGTMHTAADPYEGLHFEKGVITLPGRSGLGVRPHFRSF